MGVIYSGRYYKVVDGSGGWEWDDAKHAAQSLGGNLITINTIDEWNWFKSEFTFDKYGYPEHKGSGNFKYPNGEVQLWVGVNDAENEGVFTWHSGESVDLSLSDIGLTHNSATDDYGVWQWEQQRISTYNKGYQARQSQGWPSWANNIRGVFNGGYVNPGASGLEYKSIEFVTIASLGNSANFGDSTIAGRRSFSGSNSIRGIWAGARSNTPSPGTRHNNIDYITMATLGDALDFGDLTVARTNSAGSSTSSTRMVMQNGMIVGGSVNTIDYITMASTGDAIDFGDVANTGTAEGNAAVSSLTRGVIRSGGGDANNTLEYITIATLGNGQDFGDLNTGRRVYGSCSDSHGGLG